LIACPFIQNEAFLSEQAIPLEVEVIDSDHLIFIRVPFLVKIALPLNDVSENGMSLLQRMDEIAMRW
jgi:hypothetical protein